MTACVRLNNCWMQSRFVFRKLGILWYLPNLCVCQRQVVTYQQLAVGRCEANGKCEWTMWSARWRFVGYIREKKLSFGPKHHLDSMFFQVPEKCAFFKTVRIHVKVFDWTAEVERTERRKKTREKWKLQNVCSGVAFDMYTDSRITNNRRRRRRRRRCCADMDRLTMVN